MIARRGEVWLVDSNPIAGHEQGGRRPALVLSVDAFNASRADLVTVLPITSRARALRSRVAVQPPEGGLSSPSYIIAEQVRTISTSRLEQRLGRVSKETLSQVCGIVSPLLGL
jgi:mRNA interferase MazF